MKINEIDIWNLIIIQTDICWCNVINVAIIIRLLTYYAYFHQVMLS